MRILIADDSGAVPDSLADLFQKIPGSTADGGNDSALDLIVSLFSKQLAGERSDSQGGVHVDLLDQPEQSSTILDALGLAMLHRGRPDAGQPLIARRQFYGEDHPATAQSLNSDARAQRQLGNFAAAEAQARKALVINSRIYGSDSLPVALSLNELAAIQVQLSQFTSAEQSAQSGLKILEALHLECTDPNVTRLMDTIGRVHQVRGNYDRATQIYSKLLDLDRRQVGDHHLKYATHLMNSATVAAADGKLEQAKQDLTTAIEIIKNDVNRPRHPDVIDGLAVLGSVLRSLGDTASAQRVLKEAIELDKEVRGADHPYIGNDYARLGRVSYDAREYSASQGYFRSALDIYERNVKVGRLPAQHAYIAEAKLWLARTLVENGRTGAEEARVLAKESLATWEVELGERSVEHAITSAVLGRALYLLDHSSKEARERLVKAHPIVVAARGADSAVARLILGWLEDACGN